MREPVGAVNVGVAQNKNGNFYVLDKTNGELRLTKPYGMRTNWYSPSFSPATGRFYVPGFGGRAPNIIKEAATYVEGERFMAGRTQPPGQRSAQASPAEPPVIPGRRGGPEAAVIAISPITGDQAWQFKTKTAGILTTASDVLFTGDRDGYFRAVDARTGRELWNVLLGLAAEMSPITYAVNGRQYVSIVVGNGLFTFGLPQE